MFFTQACLTTPKRADTSEWAQPGHHRGRGLHPKLGQRGLQPQPLYTQRCVLPKHSKGELMGVLAPAALCTEVYAVKI